MVRKLIPHGRIYKVKKELSLYRKWVAGLELTMREQQIAPPYLSRTSCQLVFDLDTT